MAESSGGFASADVVHLFRHLSEPDALQSNALVADIFASAPGDSAAERKASAIAQIRKRIEHGADLCRRLDAGTRYDTRGKRQRSIILRCDLGGEPHQNVAHELGICIRHFYRERRSAQLRIAQIFAEQRPRPHTIVLDEHEASLAHAAMLAELGRSDDAITVFEALAATVDSEAKVRVLALLADTLRNFGQTRRAYSVLRAAADEACRERKDATRTSQLWLRFTEGETLAEDGSFDESERAFTAAAALLPRAAGILSIDARDGAIRASRALAWRAYRRGASSEARDYAARGLHFLAVSGQPLLLIRESLMHAHILSLHQLGTIERDEAENRLLELLRFARGTGSLEQSAGLFCTLATLANAPLKKTYRAQAQKLAFRHGSAYLQRQIHLAAAAGLMFNGDAAQAVCEVDEARKHGPGDASQRILALDIEARTSLWAGDLRTAVTRARNAHNLATAVDDQRARGAVMRTMAMVELQLGHIGDASTLINEAIPVITLHGSPSSLNLALSVRERITQSQTMAR